MASDFKDMSLDQLDDQLAKLKKEQFNLRFQRASGQLENTARIRLVRRDIARVKTAAVARARRQRQQKAREGERDYAEARVARRRGVRQERQDDRRSGRASLHPSAAEEDGAPYEEVSRARRDRIRSRLATRFPSKRPGRSPRTNVGSRSRLEACASFRFSDRTPKSALSAVGALGIFPRPRER